jgi:hypothetical protein
MVKEFGAEGAGEFGRVVEVDVVDDGEVATGVEIDVGVETGQEVGDDLRGEFLGQPTLWIAGEDAVEVGGVEDGVAGAGFVGERVGDREEPDRPAQLLAETLQVVGDAADNLGADRFVAVDGGADADGRPRPVAVGVDRQRQLEPAGHRRDRNPLDRVIHVVAPPYKP